MNSIVWDTIIARLGLYYQDCTLYLPRLSLTNLRALSIKSIQSLKNLSCFSIKSIELQKSYHTQKFFTGALFGKGVFINCWPVRSPYRFRSMWMVEGRMKVSLSCHKKCKPSCCSYTWLPGCHWCNKKSSEGGSRGRQEVCNRAWKEGDINTYQQLELCHKQFNHCLN